MSWQTEFTLIIRHSIDDTVAPYTYSDTRLQELVTVAAREVISIADFRTDYTISIGSVSISPDPTDSPRDEYFITLVTLKSICILAKSVARTASGQSLTLSDHFSSINLGGIYQSRSNDAKSSCDAFTEALIQYQLGQLIPGRIIVSPYTIDNNSPGYGRDSRTGGLFSGY